MTNSTAIGWRTVTVTDVRNQATRTGNFLKFIVDVEDPSGNYTASQLVSPKLVPGKSLYSWVRVCGVPLSSIDANLNPAVFRGKKLRAKIVMNGDFCNISDIKSLEQK